jgi:hypothetical protein
LAGLISDFSSVNIALTATPPSVANFSVPMLLVDDANVPIDKRRRIVTRSNYQTTLTSSTDAYDWCSAVWGAESNNPANAYIGRWAKTATYAYLYFPSATTTIATWTTVAAAGKFEIDDQTNTEDISPDFTADTSMADVAASITAAFVASINFTGYTAAIDVLGRLMFLTDNQGESAPAVAIGTPASGTDLSSSTYLGDEVYVDGVDAEDPEDALAAILALDNTPFCISLRSTPTIAQQVSLSTAVNALSKMCILTYSAVDAKNDAISTDTGYLIEQLGHQKTFLPYTEWGATQYPDGSLSGTILPLTEATTSFALTSLGSVSISGKDIDGTTAIHLTDDDEVALKAKGYDWLVEPSTITHFTHGLAAGGQEIRVMIGKMYTEAKISEEIYAYMVTNNVVTFSDQDIQAIKGIIKYWLDVMVTRRVLDPDYTIEMPAASDFTAATKATHIMALDDVTENSVQIAVNEITVSLAWVA